MVCATKTDSIVEKDDWMDYFQSNFTHVNILTAGLAGPLLSEKTSKQNIDLVQNASEMTRLGAFRC